MQLERSTALQRAATQLEADNKAMPDIDGFRKEIASRVELLAVLNEDRAQSTRDLTTLRSQRDALASTLLEAQIAARAFKSTRIALAPEVMLQPVGTKRLSLLVIAAVASILVAFGAIAFLHTFVVTKT